MLIDLFNHFHLTWRLLWDRRVNAWLKVFVIGLPVVYTLIPLPDDILPVIGLLDDVIFVGICTLIFNALCPVSLVNEYRQMLRGQASGEWSNLDMYRYPNERRDLAIGFAILIGLIALPGYLAGVLALALFGLGYLTTRLMRSRMLGNAVQVTPRQLPHLYRILEQTRQQLPPAQINLFVAQDPNMNAFTFGYDAPYSVVLTSGLVERLDEAEIKAVLGHEIGHVLFGHTRLINMMTGLGGWLRALFYLWNRSCEYSADAIALMASDFRPEPAISMLLKLSSGLKDVQIDVQAFLDQVGASNQAGSPPAEWIGTHPLVNNRIRRLVELARQHAAAAQPQLPGSVARDTPLADAPG